MASVFPTSLDVFPTTRASTDLVGPDVLDHADALNKIEAELGVNPSGPVSTVAARINALAHALDAFTVTHTTTLRTLDETTATTNKIVDWLGTLVDDYKALE